MHVPFYSLICLGEGYEMFNIYVNSISADLLQENDLLKLQKGLSGG